MAEGSLPTALAEPPALLAAICEHAQQRPDAVALRAHGRSDATFAQLAGFLLKTGSVLREMGIKPCTRVATLLPHAPETAVAILAVAANAAVMPINPALPRDEVLRVLRDARADVLLTTADDAAAAALAGELGLGLLELRPAASGPVGAFELRLARAFGAEGFISHEVALVLHTSGSTGTPKRVPLTPANLLHSSGSLSRSLQLSGADICLHMMPMFHIGSLVDLLLAPLSAGSCVAFAEAVSAEAFWGAVHAFQPTWAQAVPTMLRDLVHSPAFGEDIAALQKMRFVRAVSQPLPEALREDFEGKFGVPLVPIFGMTETAGLVASVPLERLGEKPASVGVAFGCSVRIADTQGRVLAAGERGEVQVRGANVMPGYEDGAAGAATFAGEWLRSGDEGYLDADGFLFLTGRLKEIVNRGGEKISLLEIDLVVESHPQVREAAAFAVPHASLGEEVALAVVPTGDVPLAEDRLRFWLRERLAEFKVPRRIVFLDRLPRLPSGKLDRRALPALLESQKLTSAKDFPTTRLGQAIARMWERTLRVRDVGLDDNFFDLGGDSLSATSFMAWLEDRIDGHVPPSLLFDGPTIRAIEAQLGGAGGEAPDAAALDSSMARAVRQAMAGWEGERVDAAGLVLGRNRTGTSAPFFWVCQSVHQFRLLASHLPEARPFYVLRSLSATRFKSDENTRRLALYYADEVAALQPDGPILIGGYCQGGLMAFRIAQALRSAGREVALLVLQDRFIAEAYDGAVAMFSGRRGWFSAYDLADRPERAWRKFYRGRLVSVRSEADHPYLHEEPYVREFASELELRLKQAETGILPSLDPPDPLSAPLDPRAVKRSISARVPLFARQGSASEIEVTVTNRSPLAWEPTERSGIILACKWRSLDLEHPWLLDGRRPLEQRVLPGESVVLTLPIRIPVRSLPMLLEIDLVEDGYRWFAAQRTLERFRRLVIPLRARPG